MHTFVLSKPPSMWRNCCLNVAIVIIIIHTHNYNPAVVAFITTLRVPSTP